VLDVAAGTGRHARLFAARGAEVVAIDRDAEALAALRDVTGIQTRVADLEGAAWPLSRENFDAIVVTNYLHRPRLRDLLGALADDGVLLYETFAAGNERFGRPSCWGTGNCSTWFGDTSPSSRSNRGRSKTARNPPSYSASPRWVPSARGRLRYRNRCSGWTSHADPRFLTPARERAIG
jgi:SAM-dependent methyltransferase